MSEVEAATNIVRHMLQPVQAILDHPQLTDLHINGAGDGTGFVDVGKGMEQVTLPYTRRDLEDLALYAAAITRQDVSEVTPLVSTKFPGGERVQIIVEPAALDGVTYFSIRKPKAVVDTPDDLERGGTFVRAKRSGEFVSASDVELRRLYREGRLKELISLAVHAGLNIVFSGEMGTGKTHLMRSFVNHIARGLRIVVVSDVHEMVGMWQPNVVHTFYSKGEQSVSKVTAEALVENSMRLGLDWLLNQELRDQAAFAYRDVLDSGHRVITTVHAESAAATRGRIKGLIKKHPKATSLDDREVMASLYRGIDLIVHCKKEMDPETGRMRRFIDEVLYDPEMKDRFDDVPRPSNREREYA